MTKYSNLPICDLRNMKDINSVKQIEEISNIAVLILPKDCNDEVSSAFSAINKSNIATTYYLSNDENVNIISGTTELSDNDFDENGKTVIVGNGIIIIKHLSNVIRGSIILNGFLVMHESVKLKVLLTFPMLNGVKITLDFNDYKVFNHEVVIDADLISYLAPKTLLIAGYKMILKNDITSSMLKEKQIVLLSGYQIVCYENVAGYVKANSTVGFGIEILPL